MNYYNKIIIWSAVKALLLIISIAVIYGILAASLYLITRKAVKDEMNSLKAHILSLEYELISSKVISLQHAKPIISVSPEYNSIIITFENEDICNVLREAK